MSIRQFEIWSADLNPNLGTEPGKKRPVLVIQTDLLNDVQHPSTLICPLTTNTIEKATLLRVHLKKGQAGLKKDSDILVDQIRAIDNRRFLNKMGKLPPEKIELLKRNILLVLDIEH
ncbi:MAG: type II toxin-antitoxin system PemK/MazF family toxin [Saprospiraceae bacterium]|nr:type II toxin-antitoxin system PemK/MazF family toxin [Saprospiraceae bacterium]